MEFKSYAPEEEEYEVMNAKNCYLYNPPPSQGGRKRAKTSDALFDSGEDTEMPNNYSNSDDNLYYDSDESELEDTQKKALHRLRRQREKAARAKAKTDAAAEKVHRQAARIASKAKRTINRAVKAATRQTPAARANAETKRRTDIADSRALRNAIRKTATTTSALPLRQPFPRYGRRKTPTHVAAAATDNDGLQSEAEEGTLLYWVIALLHFTMLD
jgi:hypothetical protein